MSPHKIPDDYVDVAQRIREFKERYPEGSLQMWKPVRLIEIGGQHYVTYTAAAYRGPDDERPGIGCAWEPVPGPTPFTKDSELMNAETSAWGRAIVALGFETKKIASAEEVRNRQDGKQALPEREHEPVKSGPDRSRSESAPLPATEQKAETGQIKQLTGILEALERGHPLPDPNYNWTTEAQAFCTETFNKTSVTLLSKAEMHQLLVEFEKRLHDHERQPF